MFTLHSFKDATAQANALADAVRDSARAALDARGSHGRATLAVSGGSSPKLFLQTLATRGELDWPRVDVTLVDDRWVGPDEDGSNERFVRETLLTHAASGARFVPLVDVGRDPEAHIAELDRAALPARPDIAVLGMGEDGHSASLFADAPEWPTAITTTERFVLVHPHAVPYTRVSWSLSAICSFGKLFLQIGGQAKLEAFKRAAAQPVENAISKIIHAPGVALDVYWFG